MLAEEPAFEDLLVCVFGVAEPVAEVYRHVVDREGCTAKELARALDHDRSSVNRKLATLREQGLVTRQRNLLSVGGFAYQYESVPLDRVQALVHEPLDEWAAFMHGRIDGVEDALEIPPPEWAAAVMQPGFHPAGALWAPRPEPRRKPFPMLHIQRSLASASRK